MSISGFGVPPAARPSSVNGPNQARSTSGVTPELTNPMTSLTGSDRELIFQATGQRIDKDFDGTQQTAPMFAFDLANARTNGTLKQGQDVTISYLKTESHRYDKQGGVNPIAPYLDKAIDFLKKRGGPSVDLNA
jgi:hypothetical protein